MNTRLQLLRLAALSFAAWLFSLPLTIAIGSSGALLGAASAVVAAQRLQGRLAGAADSPHNPPSQLRLGGLLGAAAVTLALGIGFAVLLRNGGSANQWLATLGGQSLQPLFFYKSGEFVAAFAIAASVCGSLRLLAMRSSAGRLAESLFVAASVVATLTAHRNGFIDRPFALADFALIRGYDPAYLLMGIGVGALLLLVAINLNEQRTSRKLYHLAVSAAACLLLLLFVDRVGLPQPELTTDLGLTGEANGAAQDDNPFQDSSNDPQDKATPVAVVVFHDDYEPEGGAYYFRESAYSQFDGRRIGYATRSDMDTDLIAGVSVSATPTLGPVTAPSLALQRQTVRTTIGTLIPHRAPFGLDTPTQFAPVGNPNPARFDTTYEATSAVPLFDYDVLLGREVGAADWSDEVRQEYLRLPDDPRYAELATELTQPLSAEYADDHFARAWLIKRYLDENGIYSLKNQHAAERDPAASFLFGDLTGYCVHFAFSAVYLYRSLGIPARVGVGYSVPAGNRGGGSSLLIQAIHGHAWPEVYFRDVGWVIIDPAPQQTLVDMTTDPQDNLQQMLGDMLRDDASFEQFLASKASTSIDLSRLLRGLALAAALGLALLLCAAYCLKAVRRLAPRFGSREDRPRSTLHAAIERLAGVGVSRRYGESREAFARRCETLCPSFYALTRAHLQVALSGAQQGQDIDWLALDGAMRQELRSALPRWRRIAGVINPFSQLSAH